LYEIVSDQVRMTKNDITWHYTRSDCDGSRICQSGADHGERAACEPI